MPFQCLSGSIISVEKLAIILILPVCKLCSFCLPSIKIYCCPKSLALWLWYIFVLLNFFKALWICDLSVINFGKFLISSNCFCPHSFFPILCDSSYMYTTIYDTFLPSPCGSHGDVLLRLTFKKGCAIHLPWVHLVHYNRCTASSESSGSTSGLRPPSCSPLEVSCWWLASST